MPLRTRGNARTLNEMIGQGLASIAAWMRCDQIDSTKCREQLREAFPLAAGASVNAAYRWILASNQASKNIDNVRRPTPESEIPRGAFVPSGNKYGYDVIVEVIDPTTGAIERKRDVIYSDRRLSKGELENMMLQDYISGNRTAWYQRGFEITSTAPRLPSELPTIQSSVVLATWRR